MTATSTTVTPSTTCPTPLPRARAASSALSSSSTMSGLSSAAACHSDSRGHAAERLVRRRSRAGNALVRTAHIPLGAKRAGSTRTQPLSRPACLAAERTTTSWYTLSLIHI